jgi:hypothetical protein
MTSEDVARLPVTYARALHLAAEGADDAQIAAALTIDVESVRPLLEIAEIKLAELRGDGSADP